MNSPLLTPADLGLFLVARQIVNMIFTMAKEYTFDGKCEITFFEDWRHTGPSCPSQTEQGLYLSLSYHGGLPDALYTPWGKWDFSGGGSSKGNTSLFVEDIVQRLGAIMSRDYPELDVRIYEIHKMGNLTLPRPKMREVEKRDDYQVCRSQWRELSEMYATFT